MDLAVAGSSDAVSVSDGVFAADFKEDLVHQVVVAYLAGARAGTKAQKNRAAVSGGGRKPWRQKGTGRARAGTIRSPIWRGGGRAFAASTRDHFVKVNRKQYRAAMRAIFSELARQDRLIVVDSLGFDQPKTKAAVARLAALGVDRGLLVDVDVSEAAVLSTRNIPNVFVSDVVGLDPVSAVASDKVVVSVAALKKIEEWLS